MPNSSWQTVGMLTSIVNAALNLSLAGLEVRLRCGSAPDHRVRSETRSPRIGQCSAPSRAAIRGPSA